MSSRLTNVNPCRSTKDWYDDWSPAHATPTTVTKSANFFCASSTEGASELQVPQPGAQNHITTGFSESAFDNTKDPPPTRGDVKSSMPTDSGLEGARVVDWEESCNDDVEVVASCPQAPSNTVIAMTPTTVKRLMSSS